MKRTLIVAATLVLLGLGTVHAAPRSDKVPFATTKRQIIELHASLITRAAPPVRARISASAEAARQYLATCGRSCRLYPFLRKDLTRRFTRLTDPEFRLLFGLVFAEMAQSNAEATELRLQEIFNKENQVLSLLTNLLNEKHETTSSVIDNLKS